MKLLVLSNGHGEDQIAIRIIERLQQDIPELELAALPIVGQGYAYINLQIPLAGKVRQMPSGGFIYQGGNPLWQDIRSGLVQLTIDQLKLVRQWGNAGGTILAVGDIVPLLYAWFSKANYAFVGTAKSEYYLRDETDWFAQTSWLEKKIGSVYLPWERWLMSRNQCKAVFPRDSLTTKTLEQWSIPAYDLGNPMMDGITHKTRQRELGQLDILLLPGSRMPEALNNWQKILVAAWETIKILPQQQLNLRAAISPALNLKPFMIDAVTQGWQVTSRPTSTLTLTQDNYTLVLSQQHYQEFLQQADVAIAMAGTATEQFVGLGKPAVIFPGEGPQFTYAFAEAQSRLLGCSIIMVENPAQVGKAIAEVIDDDQRLNQIALNGQRRMGGSGAAQRIAQCLQTTLLLVINEHKLTEKHE
ncbi:MAG: lipid-A-disaccharide synthase-related protein [Pleurocapsa sp.]